MIPVVFYNNVFIRSLRITTKEEITQQVALAENSTSAADFIQNFTTFNYLASFNLCFNESVFPVFIYYSDYWLLGTKRKEGRH